ncbi:MAG: UDP-N-acetylmuramoyl-tripeptide--D-alanyl-D-alanine ligase, partial [Chlamydiae bacterium]|nr:UDP-N-acetylmuramoyl-tripeptide--D-alanyl-D-alanine ligase [Chlamydiota bacterium]
MKLNSLKQIALLLGLQCSSSQMVKSFAFDSREVAGGSLFFALTGEKVDGHHFLEEGAQKGAVGAVVSKGYSGESFGLELLKVEDVVEALHLLAKKAFEMRKGRVVAITGSVGKTTTKEFLATLLEEKFSLFKTHASQNSRITVPIQLLNLMEDKEIYLVEMAMTEPGQIARLAWIAPPEIAMVTAVAPAHIAGFKEGLKGIARAKAEIFSRSETRLGVIGPTAARFDTVVHAGSCPKIVYGEDEERYPPMNLPFTASHLRENFFGAAVVAKELGMSWEEISARSKELHPFANRFEIVDEKGITFVRDCFNANPYSMEVAFKNLPAPRGGRTIGVIGSMESSPKTFDHHRLIGEKALGVFDELLCIGEECMPMVEIYHQAGRKAAHFSNLKALKQALAETA